MTEDKGKKTPELYLPRMLILLDREEKPSAFRITIQRILTFITDWLEINALPFLFIGALLNTIFLIKSPGLLSISFEVIYALIFAYKLFQILTRQKGFGTVKDADTGEPLDLVMVRVAHKNRFVQVRVTDKSGRFFVLLQPGVYTILASRAGYESQTKTLNLSHKKEIQATSIDFRLRKR